MITTEQDSKITNIKEVQKGDDTLRKLRGPKVASTRSPWSGGLSVEELSRPGGALLSMLVGRANQLGHQLAEMASELNVTYGYIAQLRNGMRKTEHVSDTFLDSCALYLGASRMSVLLASGRVRTEDVFDDPATVVATLPRAIAFIQGDARFGPLMPPTVLSADPVLQFFIVSLFEAATNTTLLPGRVGRTELAAQIQKFDDIRAALKVKTDATKLKKITNSEEEVQA